MSTGYLILLSSAVQKLSALSASLARMVSSAEEEEAQLDQFPVEGVRTSHKVGLWILSV